MGINGGSAEGFAKFEGRSFAEALCLRMFGLALQNGHCQSVIFQTLAFWLVAVVLRRTPFW